MNNIIPDSFSALKAFQDYLEVERAGARRRVILLSLFFVSLMVVAIAGLITVGIFVFEKMARQQEAAARTQDLLLQTLLRQRAGVLVPDAPSAPVEPELTELKEALTATREENARLRSEVLAIQTRKPVAPPAVSAEPPAVPVVAVAVCPQPAARQPPTHEGEARPIRNEKPAATHPDAIVTPPAREPPAEVAAAPKAPLELPPEGHTLSAPLDGYVEDVIAIPSRVSGDIILWRLLTPAP